jgi:ribokinase
MNGVLVVGSLNYDYQISTEQLPKMGETILGNAIHYSCGGKGANQAYASAKAEAPTTMIGAVGSDQYGGILKANLKKAGVSTDNIETIENESSGMSFLSIDSDGQNSIICIQGANKYVSKNQMLRNASEFKSNRIVLLQLEIPTEAVYEAIGQAKRFGDSVILNPAPYHPIDSSYLQMVDYITPNEMELSSLAPDYVTIEDKASSLIEEGVKNVIVTLGARGALLVDSKGEKKYFVPPTVKVVNTVGAGDCFNGYLAALLSKGYSVEEAISVANIASSISVEKAGAQESIPDMKEVRSFQAAGM